MNYASETLGECLDNIKSAMDVSYATYWGVSALFNMLCKYVAIINGVGYITMAILFIAFKPFPWWVLLAVIGLFYVELVAADSARTLLKSTFETLKSNIVNNNIKSCEEYNKMADNQKKQFDKEIGGILNLKSNNDQ